MPDGDDGSLRPAPGGVRALRPTGARGPQPIGYFLARFDRSLAQWSELKLNSANGRDQNALQGLENNMQKRASERRDELVMELQTGSPVNRTHRRGCPGVHQGPHGARPLLATSTKDPELVQKTLLALGVLALPETPLGGILQHLREDPES